MTTLVARWFLLCLWGATWSLGVSHACWAAQPEELPAPPASFRYMGSASCAAVDCHGGDPLRGVVRAEHGAWIGRDAHAGAFSLLYSERSLAIYGRLKRSAAYADLRLPHRERICLACHATNPREDQLAPDHRFALHDGVGCESCHGAAERWIADHVQPSWRGLRAAAKAEQGFVDTDDVRQRTRACVKCHVGSAEGDVNHDLIAADHPPLAFEMAAYQAMMPRHWTGRDNPAKLWAVGQAVAAAAAADLLVERLARADSARSVWPEFAQYDCSACHHDLADPSWRRERGFGGGRPGALPLSTWYFSMLGLLKDVRPERDRGLAAFNELYDFARRDTEFDPRALQRRASTLRDQLQGLPEVLNARQFGRDESAALLQAVLRSADRPAGAKGPADVNWETATQLYLAVVPLYQTVAETGGLAVDRSRTQPPLESLGRMRESLTFPPKLRSPAQFSDLARDPKLRSKATEQFRREWEALRGLSDGTLPEP